MRFAVPQRLSIPQKYRICQVIFAIGFLLTLFWLSRMSPGGSPHHNKMAFTGLIITVAITIPFGLAFYYYRSKLHDAETGVVAVQALANAGAHSTEPNRPKRLP